VCSPLQLTMDLGQHLKLVTQMRCQFQPKNLGGAQPLAGACCCASSGVYGADSGIFQRESNDGSWELCPLKLKQNGKILYKC